MCLIDGCESHGKTIRGMCQSHYDANRRHGDPHKRIRHKRGAALKWIAESANYKDDGCLTWPFCISPDGYGRVHYAGTQSTASRVMCVFAHGEPPTPFHQAAHSCGRGHLGCVNPKHLRWATVQENQIERAAHGTSNRGERQHKSVLTEAMVLRIKASQNVSAMNMSVALGVSYSSVKHVQDGHSWLWV